MRNTLLCHDSQVRRAALALLALCLIQPQVRAQEEVSLVFHTLSWGMVRGQTARFTVFNPDEPLERERLEVFVQVTLLDARGVAIAQSNEIAIPPGAFRSVNFKRDDLPVAGDLAGRVQTRAQVRYRSFYLVDRTQLTVWPTSIELIDDVTGRTTPLISQKPKEIVVVGSKSSAMAPAQPLTELPVIVYAGRVLMGLAYGQRLRVNASYPGAPANPQCQSVRARVRLYGANGALLVQSAEAIIAPGEFHSFDFDREEIPASGEPIGGRLPMRVSLEASATDPSSSAQDPNATGPLATSLELFDTNTGRTTAVWLTVGFFEVVPPPKPQ